LTWLLAENFSVLAIFTQTPPKAPLMGLPVTAIHDPAVGAAWYVIYLTLSTAKALLEGNVRVYFSKI
jgi:hypothetical protein